MPSLRHLPTLLLACCVLLAAGSCKKRAAWEKGKKVAHLTVRAKLGTLDPIRSSSSYDSEVQSQVYEGLYTYKYLVRPYELEPLLAKRMPQVSDDGLTYTIDIREGVYFQDNECFPGGKGRELVAKDFVYSMMRMADDQNQPTGWWIYTDRIVGFDAFEKRMSERGDAPFDWDAEVEGLQAIDKYKFQIKLVRPFPQMLYVLAMSYAFAVPRECAEYYGKTFTNTAVGTGPFTLRNWTRGSRIILDKNPTYRDAYYPTEASPEYQHMLGDAGKKIPFLDAIVYHVYEQDQPMWLKFRVRDVDMTQLPAEYHEAVFDEDLKLRESFVEEGVTNFNLPLLDFIYRGFNMDDPVVGKGEKAKYLRQAISLAFNSAEINDAFYNNSCVLYDGPVPPGLDSYVEGITSPYRGPDLEKAKALMVKAGYPDGKGLPSIQLDTSVSSNSAEQAEMLSRAVGRIGVKIEVNLNSFSELSNKLKKKKAQMFGLAWGADYPDAENFLQLFYGPNEAPGSNNFNYKNPAYDALYNKSRTLQPSPERTAVYQKMREILIEDAPSFGHMARIRFFLWHKRLRNVLPDETFDNWRKYINIVEDN
jgi:ABC-type transport system substrate-binding protein